MFKLFKKKSKKERQSALFTWLIIAGFILITLGVLSVIKVTNYYVFSDSLFGLSMKYPVDWEYIPRPNNEPGAIVSFVSPLTSIMDDKREAVTLTYRELGPNPIRIDDFTKKAVYQLTGTFEPYVEVTEGKKINVAGRRGYRFGYILRSPKEEETISPQFLHGWVIVGDKAFIFTYVATTNEYKKHLRVVNAMLKSLTIDPAKTKP